MAYGDEDKMVDLNRHACVMGRPLLWFLPVFVCSRIWLVYVGFLLAIGGGKANGRSIARACIYSYEAWRHHITPLEGNLDSL